MHTYCKTYTTDHSTLAEDLAWLASHFGPGGPCYLFSDPRWDCNSIANTTAIEFTFKYCEDYTLFVLACGDQ